jgi:hypothetical protein
MKWLTFTSGDYSSSTGLGTSHNGDDFIFRSSPIGVVTKELEFLPPMTEIPNSLPFPPHPRSGESATIK